MKNILLYKDIEIIFKRSVRGRRTTLRVRSGEVILTAPKRTSVNTALALVDKHIEWIKHCLLSYTEDKIVYDHGSIISMLGDKYIIDYTDNLKGSIYISNNVIVVNGRHDTAEKRIKKFLASHLKEIIVEIADKLCSQIEASYEEIKVRKMVSKWGSCNSKHNISFSSRLVFAPYWILEYVVAHEVCHLKEFNHSIKFWRLVESICPNWRVARAWLREHGISLV